MTKRHSGPIEKANYAQAKRDRLAAQAYRAELRRAQRNFDPLKFLSALFGRKVL